MKRYWPVRNGIAVPIYDLDPPFTRSPEYSNHHREFSAYTMSQLAVTQTLRDLERLQEDVLIGQHRWAHDHYLPPLPPSPEQATMEIVNAFEAGERLKVYDGKAGRTTYREIPKDLVDAYVAEYGLGRVIVDMARK